MSIDLNTEYFWMSFQFNKQTPEAFGLVKSKIHRKVFVDPKDNSEWVEKAMFDFGWGVEFGVMRLPPPTFDDLWDLLFNSPIVNNQNGSAHILVTEYPDLLAEKLVQYLKDPTLVVTKRTIVALAPLKLTYGLNRSEKTGKTQAQIDADNQKWQWLKNKYDEIELPYKKSEEQIHKELWQIINKELKVHPELRNDK